MRLVGANINRSDGGSIDLQITGDATPRSSRAAGRDFKRPWVSVVMECFIGERLSHR